MKRFFYFLTFLMVCFSSIRGFSQETNLSFSQLFNNLSNQEGLLTGKKGLGDEVPLEFGSARLVSCMGNLNSQQVLITALQVNIDKKWLLKKPVIEKSDSPLWTEERIFYPLRIENGNSRTTHYEELVFFPIVYSLSDSSQPFFTEKQIELSACQNENCHTQSEVYFLAVDADKGYQTDLCPAILNELNQSTFPLPPDVSVEARLNDNNQIQIIVNYPQKVTKFFLQIDNDFTYTMQKNSTNNKRAEVIITPDKKISLNDVLHLKLIAPNGWYETDIQPVHLPFLFEEKLISYMEIFKSGFIFLFFSACYLLFWSIRPQNQQQLSHTIRLIYQSLLLFALVLGTGLYFHAPIGNILAHPVTLTLQVLLLLYLLIKPTVSIRFTLPLLFCLPQVFLLDLLLGFPGFQFKAFVLSFWWGLCGFLPFFLTRNTVQLYQSFNAASKQVAHFIRLPIIISLIWIALNCVLSFTAPFEIYSQQTLQEALNNKKSVFLVLQNGPCPTCYANLISGKYFYPAEKAFKQNKLVLMKLNQNSEEGKAFLQQYKMAPSSSFSLFYGPDKQEGILLENTYWQAIDWLNYFEEVGLPINTVNPEEENDDDTALEKETPKEDNNEKNGEE